jgi:hypothetical protein
MKLLKSKHLDLQALDEAELQLWARFPEDFRLFYQLQNGGKTDTKKPSWFKYDDVRRFPDGREFRGNSNRIHTMWEFISYQNSKESKKLDSILHQHFDRHLEEEFLPSDVYVFAICEQSSLICISLRPDSYGEIYYWEWYWYYPWYKQFFEERKNAAAKPFGDEINIILDNEDDPRYQIAFDALNFATLIKVASSFSNFVENMATEATEN